MLATAPDALTALLFLLAWIDPELPGPDYVHNLMLTMVFEFIVMHSSVFFGVIVNSGAGRVVRVLMLSGLTAFYMLFIVGFAEAFHSTWPLFAFAWLFVCRFTYLLTHPVEDSANKKRMVALWAISGFAYILGGFLTSALPIPQLGITPQFVASMQLHGSGLWIEQPQIVIAFGALYFAVQACAKYALTRDDGFRRRPAMS